MPNTKDFITHVIELMRPAHVTSKAMFGGHGLYVDNVIFAIVVDDMLYLKSDSASAAAFDALDLEPFVFVTKEGQATVMTYRRAPDEALEAPDAMQPWLRIAVEASLRGAQRPAGKRRIARPPP